MEADSNLIAKYYRKKNIAIRSIGANFKMVLNAIRYDKKEKDKFEMNMGPGSICAFELLEDINYRSHSKIKKEVSDFEAGRELFCFSKEKGEASYFIEFYAMNWVQKVLSELFTFEIGNEAVREIKNVGCQ